MGRKRRNSFHGQHKMYVPVYTEEQYNKDESVFNKAIESGDPAKLDWSGTRRLLTSDLCSKTRILETGCIGDIDIRDVRHALEHPMHGWKILCMVSEKLMRISPHYYKLNSLYSNMAQFCWGVDLYDIKEGVNVENVKKTYNIVTAKLENMNLKHEFSKIMKYIPYLDIFCGLVAESATDFFIQKVDFSICKLYEIQDGLFNFAIDLSAISPRDVTAYPDYVQKAWLDLREGKLKCKWFLPPASKQICIKLNSQWTYPYPILIGMVGDILDLDIYKKLKLQSARTDNYKAIMIEVPIDPKSIDKPLITPETLGIFAEMNRASMTDDVGLIHTLGSKGEAISFKDSSNTTNNVSDAIDEIYNSSGESKELFNGSSSGTAIKYSIENSSGFIYALYRQFERWVNRYIKLRKYNKSTFKFSFYLLDLTIFNKENVSKNYKEACTLGIPVIDKYMAALDMTPSKIMGAYVTHNDIFDFYNKLKPLSTSYNSSDISSNSSGRPTAESKGETLDVEGEKTANGEKNSK